MGRRRWPVPHVAAEAHRAGSRARGVQEFPGPASVGCCCGAVDFTVTACAPVSLGSLTVARVFTRAWHKELTLTLGRCGQAGRSGLESGTRGTYGRSVRVRPEGRRTGVRSPCDLVAALSSLTTLDRDTRVFGKEFFEVKNFNWYFAHKAEF